MEKKEFFSIFFAIFFISLLVFLIPHIPPLMELGEWNYPKEKPFAEKFCEKLGESISDKINGDISIIKTISPFSSIEEEKNEEE